MLEVPINTVGSARKARTTKTSFLSQPTRKRSIETLYNIEKYNIETRKRLAIPRPLWVGGRFWLELMDVWGARFVFSPSQGRDSRHLTKTKSGRLKTNITSRYQRLHRDLETAGDNVCV